MKKYYSTLGVYEDVTPRELRNAARQKFKKYYKGQINDKLIEVATAYAILSHEGEKARYDQTTDDYYWFDQHLPGVVEPTLLAENVIKQYNGFTDHYRQQTKNSFTLALLLFISLVIGIICFVLSFNIEFLTYVGAIFTAIGCFSVKPFIDAMGYLKTQKHEEEVSWDRIEFDSIVPDDTQTNSTNFKTNSNEENDITKLSHEMDYYTNRIDKTKEYFKPFLTFSIIFFLLFIVFVLSHNYRIAIESLCISAYLFYVALSSKTKVKKYTKKLEQIQLEIEANTSKDTIE